MVNPISRVPGYNPDATYLPWPTNTQPTARPSTPYRQYATQTGPTAPIGSFGGGESGNNNTVQFDPFGTALGPQIGDWMNTLRGFLGNNTPASANTPDPITSAPSSGAVPTPVPTAQPKPAPTVTPTVSATESGSAIPDQSGGQSSGYAPVNINQPQGSVTPTVSASENGIAIPDSSGPQQPGMFSMSSLDPNQPGYTPTAADLAQWAQTPDFGGQGYGDAAAQQLALKGANPTPVSKTDQTFSTGADNPYLKMGIGLAAGMVPGGNLANMAYNAYSSGDANYEAARRGSLSPDWNKGFFGNLMNPASWAGGAIGTALGKDAGYYDNAPVLSDAASATKPDPSVMSDPNAILNGAYGVHEDGQDTTLGAIKSQLAGLFGGNAPSFDNTQMGWTGQPMTNMGGADLFNAIGASPLSWQDRGGAENMPNYGYGNSPQFGNTSSALPNLYTGDVNGSPQYSTGPSVDDLNRWAALNSTGNRWDN